MNKLALGMQKAEVLAVMGTPHSTEAEKGKETLWYLEDQGGYVHQPYYVRFAEGKVEAFGRGSSTTSGGSHPGPMVPVYVPR